MSHRLILSSHLGLCNSLFFSISWSDDRQLKRGNCNCNELCIFRMWWDIRRSWVPKVCCQSPGIEVVKTENVRPHPSQWEQHIHTKLFWLYRKNNQAQSFTHIAKEVNIQQFILHDFMCVFYSATPSVQEKYSMCILSC